MPEVSLVTPIGISETVERAPVPRSLLLTDDDRRQARARLAMRDYRCSCGKLLFRATLVPGSVVAGWCDRCRKEVIIQPA